MREPKVTCKFGWIGEGDVGVTCANSAGPDGYCKTHRPATKKTPIGTIDLTPSWAAVVRLCLEVIQNSADPSKRLAAKDEIMRCARLADLYVKEHKS